MINDDKDDKDDFEDWYKKHDLPHYLQNQEFKNKSEKDELLETTIYRKQCAISKTLKLTMSPFICNWKIDGLTSMQGLVILQLVRRINDCEDNIPKEWWCEDCKSKDIRINELIVRFRNMNESGKKNYMNKFIHNYNQRTTTKDKFYTDPNYGYNS